MILTSPVFSEGGMIPEKHARAHGDKSPPLRFGDIPAAAKSLVLIVDDPDAPNRTFNHWILFNISPEVTEIREDSPPVMATQGRNDYGDIGYGGPQPPSGMHRYFFRLYALDMVLPLMHGARRSEVEQAMNGHVLDEAELMGKYAAEQMAAA